MRLEALTLIVLVAFTAISEDVELYDSLNDPLAEESDMRVEFFQRDEEDSRPPLEGPEYEFMTQPCMGWHFQAGVGMYNADTGRELFLLSSAVEVGGAALVLAVLDDHASILHQIPNTAGAWAMAAMKEDRVAVGTYYDGSIHIYDLPENAFTSVVDIPGEAYVWNLVEGLDGRLYGGTFPGGKLIALDQDTLQIEDCGQAAPPNRFLHQVSALPDGRLLCRVGTESPGLHIYDPQTKRFTEARDALAKVSGGVIWEDYFVTEKQVFDADLQPQSPWPFPVPEGPEEERAIITAITSRHVLYLQQGDAVYRYRAGDAEPTLIFDFELRGGRLFSATMDGGVIGVRGQQYFHISPGSTAINRLQFSVASPPRAITFLRTDARNQVWGAPASGQTLFFMDGDTGVFVSMGSVTPRMGRVLDIAFIEQVAYGVAYPGGDIFRLDIEEAWNEWGGRNPRILESLRDKGYSWASGGIVASTSLLFTGWSADSGNYGGAIAATNPATGRTRILENPLGRQGITGLALDAQFLFAGTTLKAEGMPVKTGESPQFAVLGLDTVQPYWNHTFEGAVTVDKLLFNPHANHVAMSVDGRLHTFDVIAMRIQDTFKDGLPEVTSASMAVRQDAYIYYGHENILMRAHLIAGVWEKVIELPQRIGGLAANAKGELYAACANDVYRIRFPDPYPEIQGTQKSAE